MNVIKALVTACFFMGLILSVTAEDELDIKNLLTKYEIPKEAVDTNNLRPIYKDLIKNKIRGIYDHVTAFVSYKGKRGVPKPTPELPVKLSDYTFEGLDAVAKMKFNVVIANFNSRWVKDFKLSTYLQLLVGKACRMRGMKLLVKANFGSDHCKSYRRYCNGVDNVAKRTPCPLDSGYWRQVILERAMVVAKNSLLEKGIIGYLIDFEMYESDMTSYNGACMCDYCFKNFLKIINLESMFDSIKPKDRAAWVKLNNFLELYQRVAQYEIYKITRNIEQELHKVNPDMVLALFPAFEWVPGVERGLGTSTQPVIVFSEIEYRAGFSPIIRKNIERIKAEKYPVLYCPGFWPIKHGPDVLPGEVFKMADESIGYWVYAFFYLDPRTKNSKLIASPKLAEEYRNVFTKGNNAIIDLAKNPQYQPDFALPLYKNAKLPKNKIEFAKIPPEINGKLNDVCWKKAQKMIMKESWKGGKYPFLTTAFLSYDNKYLYLAVKCTEPATPTMKIKTQKNNKNNFKVFNDEHLEIFIDSNSDKITYYQFGVNPNGAVAGQRFAAVGATDKSWRPSGIKISAAVNKNYWVMEMAIPLSSLGISEIKQGDTWGMNINRFRFNSKTDKILYGAWSPTFGGFHQPPRFGKITF